MTMPCEPVSVSLNGVDNVGKSTQVAWLHHGIPEAHLVGTVDAWDSRWADIAAGDFGHWWFVGSTTAEHVGLMLGSHSARRAASRPWALEDRGLPMLRAACAATAAIKEGSSTTQALQLVDHIAADLPAAKPRREVHVLLRRFDDPQREARAALRREPHPVGQRYSAYQHALAAVIALQVERGEYDTVLDIGDAPILDVQRQLRAQLADFEVAVPLLPADTLDRLWVLAGMSEGGKSTVGELLRDEHGVTRLKIGYLLEVAALRAGASDPYQWPTREQAELLTEEILRFAATSKARTISIESAHSFEATAHLKRVWGDRCQIVYVDADSGVRASRAVETEAQLHARDATKHERGAHRIADIADHVIDNAGPLSALKLAVTRLTSSMDVPHVPLRVCDPVTHGEWLEQTTAHLLDDQVALMLATGSTGTTKWHEGWSDLDVLVVRDTLPATWLRDIVGTLPAPENVKVAVSAFTVGDLDAVRVPSRVAQSLRRAAHGIGVLYQRPGYLIPVPVSAHVDRAGRGELGLILMTTRRLLTEADTNVRAVYKHLLLLAKILLHADGYDFDDAEDVLAVFRDLHPEAACTPPDLDVLIQQSHDPASREQLIKATHRLLAYFDRLDHTVRTSP
jgi:hypothetical protein